MGSKAASCDWPNTDTCRCEELVRVVQHAELYNTCFSRCLGRTKHASAARSLGANLVKEAGKVNVDAISRGGVHKDVLPMPVSQPQHVTYHAPDCRGSCEGQPGIQPAGRLRELRQEELLQHGREHAQDLV